MEKFNFKSQIATDKVQSERLLALGLKKETADCSLNNYSLKGKGYQDDWQVGTTPYSDCLESWSAFAKDSCWELIPAWSLHRMWELICNRKKYESKEGDEYPKIYLNDDCVIVENPKSIWARHNFCSLRGVYENVINCIEWLIKEGYFNKEYLEE